MRKHPTLHTLSEAELALQESEQRARALSEKLHTLIESLPDAVLMKDGEGHLEMINAAAKRLLDLENVPWKGQTDAELAEMQPRQVRQLALSARHERIAWETGQQVDYETELGEEFEKKRHGLVSKVPIFSEKGDRLSMVTLARNITPLKEAELTLRLRDALLSAVTFFAERLLRSEDWEEGMLPGFERIGFAGHFLRISLIRPKEGSIEEDSAYRSYLWTHPNRFSAISASKIPQQHFSGRWFFPAMRAGQSLFLNEKYTHSYDAIQWMKVLGVKSLALIPVMVEEKLFAAMSFHDDIDRKWNDAEVDALLTIGNILGAAIERQRTLAAAREAERVVQHHRDNLQKLVEERTSQLAASRARWKFALEGNGDGLWDWDIENNYFRYTRRYCEMLGYQRGELGVELKDWMARIHPDALEEVKKRLEECLAGKVENYVAEYQIQRKDGTWLWVLDRGMVIDRDHAEAPLRMIGTHVDISERKTQEKALVEAMEAAKAANQAKSAFLANMSHELRTPMHAILSFAHIALTSPIETDPNAIRGYLEIIEQSGKRLLFLLNDLLDLAKLESGKMRYEMGQYCLCDIIQDVIDEYAPLIEKAAVQVNRTTHCDHCLAWFDKYRIHQVIANLLDNALKFSPPKRTIKINCQPESSMDFICLTVEDEGIGIPETELNTIFDKFVQSTKTHSGRGGTGLGLAICREIIEGHGGTIFAANQSEGGACFTVKLPVQKKSI